MNGRAEWLVCKYNDNERKGSGMVFNKTQICVEYANMHIA